MRGHDTGKPVILFLHGGSGTGNIVWGELFITDELEEKFVVVLWDQRGAGKSFCEAADRDRKQNISYEWALSRARSTAVSEIFPRQGFPYSSSTMES
jgi:pimeloyl-ACP methyl ester carboxylesterase